jgi:hypothetical protein
MVEVPVKLDASWAPLGVLPPHTTALRIMSDPGLLDHEHMDHFDHFVFEDPHPGTKVSNV